MSAKKAQVKKYITLGIGTLISVACLYWVFKDVDLGQLGKALLSVDPLWLILSLIFFYISMYLRAARWSILFRPNYTIPGSRLFRPLMIGFAYNSILPGRIGELARSFYVGQKENTGMPTALATVVSERIFDGVTLLLFLAIALSFLPEIDPAVTVTFGKFTVEGSMLAPLVRKIIFGCIVLVAGVVFVMIPGVEGFLAKIIRNTPAVPDGVSAKLIEILRGIVQGFESIRSPKNLALVVAYSLGVWILVACSNFVLARGIDGVDHINILQSISLVSLIAIFILIPAAPGYWGLYEAGVLFGLKVLSVQSDETIGTAYALATHLVQFVPIVVIGLIFAAQSHVSVKAIEPTEDEETDSDSSTLEPEPHAGD